MTAFVSGTTPNTASSYTTRRDFTLVSSKSARTTNISNLNIGRCSRMPVPLPPLQLQQEFARRAEAVDRLRATYHRSLAELGAMFASLQHRAFRGELTSERA